MRNFKEIVILFLMTIVVYCCQNKIDSQVERVYYPNGNLKSEKIVYDKNRINEKKYNDKGIIQSDILYKDTVRDGVTRYYSDNGILTYEENYILGKVREVREFFPNGQTKSIVVVEWEKQKAHVKFNEDGFITYARPFVSIQSEKDTVFIGETYSAKLKLNLADTFSDTRFCVTRQDPSDPKSKLCEQFKAVNYSWVYTTKAMKLGENIYDGNVLQYEYHPTIRDSVVEIYRYKFSGKFFVKNWKQKNGNQLG